MKEKTLLLTGAGFTHNFGTPLASDMWTEIFNNKDIQNYHSLRRVMLDNIFEYNYESIYHHVLNTDFFTEKEKDVMEKATSNAYDGLDDIVIGYNTNTQDFQYQISFFRVKEFIIEFFRRGSHYLFTLNQDLFLERKFINQARNDNIQLSILGIFNYLWFDTRFDDIKSSFTLPDKIQLEDKIKVHSPNNGYHYIKLHGAQNWNPSTGKKGMVIGINKEMQIKNEPLLNWYFEIFKEALFQTGVKLLTIGYSFSDEHINKIIAEAILQYNLKMYILMPKSPDRIIQELTKRPYGEEILEGVYGFFPYKLSDVFPLANSITPQYRKICECIF